MRARVKNDKAATLAQKYSAYTNTASFNAGMPNISVTNVITAKTVTLNMSAESGSEGWLTGYQIQDVYKRQLRGMGHSGVPMILSIIGTVGTRIVWIFWIFPQHRSLYTLFISYPASWFITIVLQVFCFVFVRQTVHGQLKGTGKAA